MSDCDRCVELSEELKREQKRSTGLTDALVSIYGIAKDKMWYPSTFEVRGESGFKESDRFVAADLANVPKGEGYSK